MAAEAEEEVEGGTQGDVAKAPPPHRRADQHKEGHKTTGSGEETEAEEEEIQEEESDRDGEIPRGAPVEVTRVGGTCPPPPR